MDVQSYAIAASWAYFVALDIRLATDTTIDRNTRISAEVGSVGWGYFTGRLIDWNTPDARLINLLLCDVFYKNNSLV